MATPIELEGTDQTLESPKENDTRKLKQFEEFGLGRGVDVTDPTPFVNKKPFQVRPIDSEDAIICTNEGGALQSIIQKIESSRSVQMNVSLTIPKPIEIDAPAEYSRSIMQKGHILGRKVVTRTVAFRKDRVIGKDPTDFENLLKTYINKADADVGKKRSSKLLESIKTIAPSDDSNRILSLLEFIAENGITHYVSKIHLGAAEYRTMSETHYSSFVSGKQHLGLEKIAHLAVDRKDENTTHLDEVKRIGYMDDSYVVKKDEQEGVVDVQLESIANLISDENLKKELTAALNIYTYLSGLHTIGSKMDEAIPPYDQHVELVKFIRPLQRPPSKHEASHKYAICCDHGNDQLFLDIKSDSNQVIATKCEGQLNFFHLQLTEKPDELIIVDYAEFPTRTETLVEDLSYDFWPTPRYLKVKTLLGYNRGPLCVEDSVDEYYCRLKLCPRLYSKHKNVTVNDFTNGKDTFYICTSGRWGMTGYLYLKPTKDGDFITACKPRWNWMYNRGNSHKHMLFRLVRYENMYVPDPTRTNNIAKLSPIENENATTAGTEDNMERSQEESRAKCSSVHTALYKPVFGLFLLSVPVLLAALYWRKRRRI